MIIEDRIREWEAGRRSSGLFCPAANPVAQSSALTLVAFQAISNRNLTMRPASASRLRRAHLAKGASEPRRTTRGICSTFSNRELTMRRASASRASALRRTTRGICSAISNREPNLLEPSLSYRKQTTAPSSNRELPTKRNSQSSQVLSPLPPQIHKWSRPLLTESAPQTEFNVNYRKQTTEKFLTEARTHIRGTRFAQHSDASPLGFPK